MDPIHLGKSPSAGRRIAVIATLGLTLLAGPPTALATPHRTGGPEDGEALIEAAANLELRFGRQRNVRGEAISKQLSPPVRAALNDWAETAARLGLSVAVGERAECLLLGRCEPELLEQAVDWVDDTWDLLADLAPAEPAWHDATVVFLFDRPGAASATWSALFDELATRKHLPPEGARHFATETGSVLLRGVPAFVQTTWDTVGDAAAGDDEFRLANEVAHKLTQCLLEERFGTAPDCLRWGLGYVVEQRLFRSIYQFNGTGFVAASSHEEWPKRTAQLLGTLRKSDEPSLARLAWSGPAGQASEAQLMVWGALDQLLHERPAQLAELLTALADLHSQAVPFGFVPSFAGDAEPSLALLAEHLDTLDLRRLQKHVKRVK